MGYNISTTIIENLDKIQDDRFILDKLGLSHFVYIGKTIHSESTRPLDDSLSVAFYKNYILINDDFRFTESIYSIEQSDIESKMIDLFPKSKILNVCCISSNGFQAFHLIKNGKRLRYKTTGDNYGFSEKFNPLLEYGLIPNEEKTIFNLTDSDFVNGITKCIMGFELENEEDIFSIQFNKFQSEDYEKYEDWENEDIDDIIFNNNAASIDSEKREFTIKKWWQFWR